MTQPISLHAHAGGVLEESSDGIKHSTQGCRSWSAGRTAVQERQGRTWASQAPRMQSQSLSTACWRQPANTPRGVAFVLAWLVGCPPDSGGGVPATTQADLGAGCGLCLPAGEFFALCLCCAPSQLLFTLNRLLSFPCG